MSYMFNYVAENSSEYNSEACFTCVSYQIDDIYCGYSQSRNSRAFQTAILTTTQTKAKYGQLDEGNHYAMKFTSMSPELTLPSKAQNIKGNLMNIL